MVFEDKILIPFLNEEEAECEEEIEPEEEELE